MVDIRILLVVFTPTYTPFRCSFAEKGTDCDTIGAFFNEIKPLRYLSRSTELNIQRILVVAQLFVRDFQDVTLAGVDHLGAAVLPDTGLVDAVA